MVEVKKHRYFPRRTFDKGCKHGEIGRGVEGTRVCHGKGRLRFLPCEAALDCNKVQLLNQLPWPEPSGLAFGCIDSAVRRVFKALDCVMDGGTGGVIGQMAERRNLAWIWKV